jgi:glycosyltransferase involved in cell wall biosynthesis
MQKKILLKAPILTRSGYGEQSRFALRALRSREDLFDIYIQPLTWGQTSWVNIISEERDWIDQKIEKTISFIQEGQHFDATLQVSIPNEWQELSPLDIGYTAGIETTKVAHQWIEAGNKMKRIIVVSDHSKNIYENTVYDAHNEQTGETVPLKLTKEVTAVNYPAKTYENLEQIEMQLDYDFNFVCVAQAGPRKNLMNTIKWFVEEFHDDSVGLIVKTNIAKNCLMDREVSFNQLVQPLNKEFPDRKCKVYLLHGDMTDEEMHAMYTHPKVRAAVSFTHGEGFGLPLFEAAYMGIPVIAPGWSGQCDFLFDNNRKEKFYNVSFDINAIPEAVLWEGVLIKESGWCYPRETSAKEKMRLCYNDISRIDKDPKDTKDNMAAVATSHAEYLKEEFEKEKMYAEFISAMGIEKEFDVENWVTSLDIEEIE